MKFTFTAAWWWVKVNNGPDESPAELTFASQIKRRLSFPPLARYLPSCDHFKPHTSWVWHANVATWWSATRTSWWWIAPLRLPLKFYSRLNIISVYIYSMLYVCLFNSVRTVYMYNVLYIYLYLYELLSFMQGVIFG